MCLEQLDVVLRVLFALALRLLRHLMFSNVIMRGVKGVMQMRQAEVGSLPHQSLSEVGCRLRFPFDQERIASITWAIKIAAPAAITMTKIQVMIASIL